MSKCFAPCAASWRGRAIAIADDGSCELSREGLDEMRAHGFREWTPDDEAKARRRTLAKPAAPKKTSHGGE